jgi:hypothetical protein
MALIILGASTCAVCNHTLHTQEDLISFPPFVPNTRDLLYVFHDAGFHKACFDAHPLADAALARLELLRLPADWDDHRCAVCEQTINHPDDLFTLAGLASSAADPLYAYHALQLHQTCLPGWDALQQVVTLLDERQASGTWGGSALIRLQQRIEQLTTD